jgi:hypothetical protein
MTHSGVKMSFFDEFMVADGEMCQAQVQAAWARGFANSGCEVVVTDLLADTYKCGVIFQSDKDFSPPIPTKLPDIYGTGEGEEFPIVCVPDQMPLDKFLDLLTMAARLIGRERYWEKQTQWPRSKQAYLEVSVNERSRSIKISERGGFTEV